MTKYVVVWENNANYIFSTVEEAVEEVIAITGKTMSAWDSDNGDTDEDGNNVYFFDAEEK